MALPLHHPLTIAKSASSIDVLSEGRMILGVASGDRPQEYPAMNIDFENRGELFRDAFDYIRKAQESFPRFTSQHYGGLNGQMDVLPKPTAHKIPLLITGSSRQSLEWNAKNGDGWMSYPRNLYEQKQAISQYRSLVEQFGNFDKPFMQPLYIDLMEDNHFKPQPIHLGFRIGIDYLNDYVLKLKEIGVNHLAFNLR
ncbi:MAG: LLM class flavin-dependent oxidoreductase [Bacteroidota bacterium]